MVMESCVTGPAVMSLELVLVELVMKGWIWARRDHVGWL